MFENINQSKKFKLYSLKTNAIKDAEKQLGIKFPKDLMTFYSNFGYGFIESKECNVNRIMDPGSVAEFRTATGQFADNEGLTLYDKFEKDKLVFFEVNESTYLSIGFSKENEGKVYYFGKEIADDLESFFEQYLDTEDYYL